MIIPVSTGDGHSAYAEAFDGPIAAPSLALTATFDMEGKLLPLLMPMLPERLLLCSPSPHLFKSPRSSYYTSYDPPPPPLSFTDSKAAFLSNLKNVSTFQTPRSLNPQQSTRIPPPLPFVLWPSAVCRDLVDLSIRWRWQPRPPVVSLRPPVGVPAQAVMEGDREAGG